MKQSIKKKVVGIISAFLAIVLVGSFLSAIGVYYYNSKNFYNNNGSGTLTEEEMIKMFQENMSAYNVTDSTGVLNTDALVDSLNNQTTESEQISSTQPVNE